ncbi:hypothetical protein PsAD2_04618 [Pseudovibrio axinellae]|uniref:Fibronectin type-III domain-containing protein n=1 Tax=Pseudovibrio axinellae TaxID=989403 RepID=A0A165SVP7_9HYPH|nr:fibronectin type III domain-containing protein [Pseudovibrio axinellae]KZL04535.1 hypothetical protein PsAD2_04618 [Pseudovibrio axinellae]SEQ74011.1 hypothetical protein SAMN05421798_10490 [Pseudovibrio axinellae]
MVETVAFAVAWAVSNAAAGVGVAVAGQATLAAGAAALVGPALTLGLSAGVSYLGSSFFADGSEAIIPKPADGQHSIKQEIPPLSFAYGHVKKGGFYVFLEEHDGTAYSVIVLASHPIEGVEEFYLNDIRALVNDEGIVEGVDSPDAGSDKYYVNGPFHVIQLLSRNGDPVGVPYPRLPEFFPSIWGEDYRGDGLATIYMHARSADAESFTTIYPNSLPAPIPEIKGKNDIYDPRTGTRGYTENLALIYLDFLCMPFGGKQALEDFDLDSWSRAADCCGELVTNRSGELEPRYFGGIFGNFDMDPVTVQKYMAGAAELVLFETGEGKLAVHAGEWIEPDIHIQTKDIIAFSYEANLNPASRMESVRGRWTNPETGFATEDAAIFGNTNIFDGDARSETLDNPIIQRHNHCQRLQKIYYTRKRAAFVTLTVDYFAAQGLMQSRFVKVTHKPYMDGGYIEITGRPKLILRPYLRYEISGRHVPDTLFDFDAASEEGEPAALPEKIGTTPIPLPENVSVKIKADGDAVRAYATFESASNNLTYQLLSEQADGQHAVRDSALSGKLYVYSAPLIPGEYYNFKMRSLTALGVASEWTDTITLYAQSDPNPPGNPLNVSVVGDEGQAIVSWKTPNSDNFGSTAIYRGTTSNADDAEIIDHINSAASSNQDFEDTGLVAGTYYYWVSSVNRAGVGGDLVLASGSPVIVS